MKRKSVEAYWQQAPESFAMNIQSKLLYLPGEEIDYCLLSKQTEY